MNPQKTNPPRIALIPKKVNPQNPLIPQKDLPPK